MKDFEVVVCALKLSGKSEYWIGDNFATRNRNPACVLPWLLLIIDWIRGNVTQATSRHDRDDHQARLENPFPIYIFIYYIITCHIVFLNAIVSSIVYSQNLAQNHFGDRCQKPFWRINQNFYEHQKRMKKERRKAGRKEWRNERKKGRHEERNEGRKGRH